MKKRGAETEEVWKDLFSALRLEDWDEAITSVDDLIKKEPTDPDHFAKRGDLYLKEDNLPSAIAAYKTALALYKKAALTGKAILTCKKILTVSPQDQNAKKDLSSLLKTHSKEAALRLEIPHADLKKKAQPADDMKRLRGFLTSEKLPAFLKSVPSELLLQNMAMVKFKPGQNVITEGETGESVFVLVRGVAEVSSTIQGKRVVLASLGEGDFFGEMAFLTSKPRTATITAFTDCDLIEFDKPRLERLLEPRPHMLRDLYQTYSSRIETTMSKLKTTAKNLSGNLRELALPDMLQIFDQSKKQGVLFISAGGEAGSITFRDGTISDASFGRLRGEDALAHLLSLDDGTFTFTPKEIGPGVIEKPIHYLLMEVARLIDERDVLRKFVPDDKMRLVLRNISTIDNRDLKAVVNAVRKGASTIVDVQKVSRLSRIRVELAVARLVKSGFLTAEGLAPKKSTHAV